MASESHQQKHSYFYDGYFLGIRQLFIRPFDSFWLNTVRWVHFWSMWTEVGLSDQPSWRPDWRTQLARWRRRCGSLACCGAECHGRARPAQVSRKKRPLSNCTAWAAAGRKVFWVMMSLFFSSPPTRGEECGGGQSSDLWANLRWSLQIAGLRFIPPGSR